MRIADLEEQRVADHRTAEPGRVVEPLVAAHRGHDVAEQFRRGLARQVVHGAREGIAAVERALRALQHLDALDVGEAEVEHRLVRQVDAVVEHGDVLRAVGQLGVGEAAQHQAPGEAGRVIALVVEARGAQRDVGEVLQRAALDLLGAERVDHQRDVLQRLGALARGDHDLVERAGGRVRLRIAALLRLGRQGRGPEQQGERGEAGDGTLVHGPAELRKSGKINQIYFRR